MAQEFMFATGIECSYPTVGARRVDELEKCGHYARWREDFELVREMGIRFLRFGGPYYRMHEGPGRYDWSFLDETLPVLRGMGIEPILDLCHFGVPDWIGDFQNEDWPRYFAEFAREASLRYPWVRFITPVNEIYVAALYSGQYGYWNEAMTSHEGFVRAATNLCKANVMAMSAIVEARDGVQFIQSESSQYFHAKEPAEQDEAYFLNERRFLPLDLTYAFPITVPMYRYLLDHGMRQGEYDWFQRQKLKAHCIMGNDYYARNEHIVSDLPKLGDRGSPRCAEGRDQPGGSRGVGINLGYYAIAKQYYERYRLPMMHTETNLEDPNAVYWLWQNWAGLVRLRKDYVPVCGFTWYSLIDQVDWDSALTEDNGTANPLGLYDLDRKIRPVGDVYRRLVHDWDGQFPSEESQVHVSRW